MKYASKAVGALEEQVGLGRYPGERDTPEESEKEPRKRSLKVKQAQ